MKYILLIAIILAAFTALFFFWRSSPAPQDLTAFAQCLADKKVTMYGAAWCPHCQNQKKLFGEAWKLVPYVECPEDTQKCLDLKINGYPTWIFANGTRLEGEQSLEALANASGCQLTPTSSTPIPNKQPSTPSSNEKSDNGAGGVTVSASFTAAAQELVFAIALNTHSIDLDSFNPATQFSLQDQNGTKIAPSRIQPEGEGHHRSFTVTFSKPKGPVKLITANLAGVPQRELTW